MPTPHVKYYGKEQDNNQKSQQKVEKIAKKVVRWIIKNQRNIYPDNVSKTVWILQPINRFFDSVMYKNNKEQLY